MTLSRLCRITEYYNTITNYQNFNGEIRKPNAGHSI